MVGILPNIDLNIKIKPIKLFGGKNPLKMKPIVFGPSFDVTSKQGTIPPLKESAKLKNVKRKIENREIASIQKSLNIQQNEFSDDATTQRVQNVMNGTDILEASGLARPTGSKVRELMREKLQGKNLPPSIFSGREFEVAFIGSNGVISRKRFRSRSDADAFRKKLQAQGLLEDASPPTIREVS